MRFRLSVVKHARNHGVISAAIRYRKNRQYVYRWLRRYDGTIESLRERSRRPHSHKNQHTPEELKLIYDMRKRNTHLGLGVFLVKLQQRGYSRSITGLYRVLRRHGIMANKPRNPKHVPKSFEQIIRPGQRVQVDVKHVPASSIVANTLGHKFYQYTVIDEFLMFRYVEVFEEANTYTSTVFLEHMLSAFKFHVDCVQTDNGFELTKHFSRAKGAQLSLFEKRLVQLGIKHKRIRPFTPRHNGKVERPHRKDNEYFYAMKKFYSFDDFRKQLYLHNWRHNRFPMRPLGWKSPVKTLMDYTQDGVTYV